ncbi:thiol reductant ABC exporter subunit CydC [Paeniglutamicibacter sp. R2-26]|uniref:thiol reductant ABC exporter subunit CydC n=1 Tax=Paeniglutamicibacter sp. R2-26 TaxID=3144417 RepID=UPI003EE69FB8
MKRRTLVAWLVQTCRSVMGPLGLASLLGVAHKLSNLGLYLVAGLALGRGAEALLSGGQPPSLWPAAAWLAGLSLAKGMLRYGEQYVGHKVAFKALALLRGELYAALAPQAPFNARTRDSGDMLTRATRDIDRVEVFFAHTIPPLVAALVVPVAVVVPAWLLAGGELAAILAAGLALAGLAVPWMGLRATRTAAREATAIRARIARHVGESVGSAGTIVAFGHEARRAIELAELDDALGAALARGAAAASWRAGLKAVVPWGTAAVLCLAGLGQVADGRLDLAGFLCLLLVAVPAFGPVLEVDGFVSGLQDSFASAERLHALIHRAPQVPDAEHPVALPEGPLSLEVRGAGLVLEGESGPVAVLDSLDLEVPAGRSLAVVGGSGSGKSTLAALLVRALDPDTGTVWLGRRNVRDAALKDVRGAIAMVSQREHLMRGTLRSNLLVANPRAGEDEMLAACRRAGLGEWLAAAPKGLDTPLGERGGRISGGQAQRVALARAFVKDARVLVLDEASSALDVHTEALVMDSVRQLAAEGRTVVVIAHRMRTVLWVDEVAVLEAGRLVEKDSPARLAGRRHGRFAALLRRERESLGE